MKKLSFLICLCVLSTVAFAQLPTKITEAKDYIDSTITANGTKQITAVKLNTGLNKIITALKLVDSLGVGDSLRLSGDTVQFRKGRLGTWRKQFVLPSGGGGGGGSGTGNPDSSYMEYTKTTMTTGGTAAANSTALTADIAAAASAGKGVFIPDGTYMINSVTINPVVPIKGSNYRTTVLKSGSAVPLLKWYQSDINFGYNVRISDLKLDGNGVGTIGMDFKGISNSTFKAVGVVGFTTGMKLRGCIINRFLDGYFIYNTVGMDVDSSFYTPAFFNLFSNYVINENSQWAVKYFNGASAQFINTDFEKNGTNGVDTTGTIWVKNMSPVGYSAGVGLVVQNSWFEQDSGTYIIRIQEPLDLTINEISNTIIRGNGAKQGVYIQGASNINRLLIKTSHLGNYDDSSTVKVNGAYANVAMLESSFRNSTLPVKLQNGGSYFDYTNSTNWLQGGNTTTNPVLGTLNNRSLLLISNNVTRGILDSLGRWGFGTTAPKATVHVSNDGSRKPFYVTGGGINNNTQNLLDVRPDVDGTDSVVIDKRGSLLIMGGGSQAPSNPFSTYKGLYLNPNSDKVQVWAANITGVQAGFFAHSDGSSYWGTGSNHSVKFMSNNLERGILTNSGNWTLGSSTDGGSKVNLVGSFSTSVTFKSSDYTLTASDQTVYLTVSNLNMTLPTAVGCAGREYLVKLNVSGVGYVTTTASQTIDGAGTYILSSQYDWVRVKSNGSNWLVIGAGALPTTPGLEAVLGVANTASNSMYLTGDGRVIEVNTTDGYVGVIPNGSNYVKMGNVGNESYIQLMREGFSSVIKGNNLTADRVNQLPDNSGTFAVTVDGIPADDAGNINTTPAHTGIDLSASSYTITQAGVYRIDVGGSENLNFPYPAAFKGTITIINKVGSISLSAYSGTQIYKAADTSNPIGSQDGYTTISYASDGENFYQIL